MAHGMLLAAASCAASVLVCRAIESQDSPRIGRTANWMRGDKPPVTAYFTVNTTEEAQVILGIGFEIQSDSIGSGNNGLPDANTSVPWDLVQSEKDRFFSDMLAGFRYCRLAMGLYFRGTTPDGKNVVERWPGQAAGLAEMATKSGIEGFAVEYWSPPPGWKSTSAYIDGTLSGFDEANLEAFGTALVQDAQYLEANGMPVVWWGLQNEPAVGPGGCSYSCCGYNATEYYLAFKAAGSKIKQALPSTVIHASSWSGQYYSPQISADPQTLALVDAWTFHHVGANSNDQIQNQAYFLAGAAGKPVMNNEYEYLDNQDSPERTINTAQSLMNWLVFENSPSWYWLHALKPLGHAEAAGYGLGYWQPWVNSSSSSYGGQAEGEGHSAGSTASGTGLADDPSPLPPGYWEYNPLNFNSVAGFTKYMPWDSVRVNVTEVPVPGFPSPNPDVRVLAYRYDPAKARWRTGLQGQGEGSVEGQGQGQEKPIPARPAPSSTKAVLSDDRPVRAAATKLAFVVSNRWNETAVNAVVSWDGLTALRGVDYSSQAGALPSFTGHWYGPNTTDGSLGTLTAQLNTTTGLPYFTTAVQPYSIQFWVED